MVKYTRVTNNQRELIKMAIDAGVPTKEIALSIGVDRTTIWRISKRYTETGLIGAIPRSPRKPKIDERTFRAAFRELQQKRRQSLTVFRSILRDRYDVEYSRTGIYYIMKRKGITAKIRSRKPMICKRNRVKRIAFAKAHRNWTKEDWGRVIWTDESLSSSEHEEDPIPIPFIRVKRRTLLLQEFRWEGSPCVCGVALKMIGWEWQRFYQGISTPQCIWSYWMMKGNELSRVLNVDRILFGCRTMHRLTKRKLLQKN